VTLPLIHRKHAVENTEMLDFLKELVQGVPDPSAGGTVDLEAEGAEKKKRGKGKRPAAGAAAGAGASTSAAAAGSSKKSPVDPDVPAAPKKRRRKKKETLEAAAAAAAAVAAGASSAVPPDTNKMDKMAEDSHGEDHDYDGPAPRSRRMLDEDMAMKEDPDEYDADESMQPPPPPRSPIDEEDYED
jgi:hypothetical protein